MVVEIIRNGVKFYVHTAWANDTAGTDFSLTEYEEALFVGNYIDRSSAESNLHVKYAWKEIHKVDDENVSATEDGLTDYEERMSDLEASARENADDLAGTQQSTDSAIGNPNLLLNTNNGTANYSTTIGYSIEELVDSIGEGTEYIKCVKVTCNTPSDSGMLFFNADSLRDVLGSAVDENTYTLSMHTRMSTLFDIELIAVQNSDGENQQLVYDVLSNASEDDDVILDDEWVFYESTTQCTEVASDAQMLCMSLANMPAGAYLIIANLKIEAGAIATPWRESVEEVSREVKVIHEKVVVTEAEVKKVSGELASFKTGEFENLKAGVAEIEKAYIKEADVETIIAGKGYITDLQTKTLLSDYAKVTTLESDYVKTNQLEAKVGTFGYLKTTSLESEVGKFGYLKATSLESEVGKFGYLKANELEANVGTFGYIKATDVAAKYATIDLANIKAGSITQAMIGTGVVGTAQIANSSITDAKIVELTANKINAGILSVERLEIRGSSNSIVYALNNITGALQAQNVDTLNGEVLTPRTITADRIVTNAITANEIATRTITANNILAGTITATEIASNTITANEIAAGTITANEINVADLFAQQITVTGSLTGNINRTKITSDGMEILDASGNTVAQYGPTAVYLGKNSQGSVIDLNNGLAQISNSPYSTGHNKMVLASEYAMQLKADGSIYHDVYIADGTNYNDAHVHVEAWTPWTSGATITNSIPAITLVAENGKVDKSSYNHTSVNLLSTGMLLKASTKSYSTVLKLTDLGMSLQDGLGGTEWISFGEGGIEVENDLTVNGDSYLGYVRASEIQATTKFVGTLEGTASKAIADANGNNIVDTYATKGDISAAVGGNYLPIKGLLGSYANTANNGVTAGLYTLNNSSTTGLPATGLYGAFFQLPGDYKPQMVIGGTDGEGTIYVRRYLTGSSSWTAWARMATTADLGGYALAGHTHNYLPMSGGMLEGSLKFQSGSLPQKNLEYICGIDAFAAGGEMGWQSKGEFLAGYATTAYVDSKVASVGGGSSEYPAGFASRTTGATWGNTIGTSFTSWNDSTGGSIDFRRDNPSAGKVSIKVDGRVYVNEGLNPVMGMESANGYWGMCTPDGVNSDWIRTSTLGIIPYQAGGHGSIGTLTWPFSVAYVNTIYEGGTALSSKYLALSGGTMSGPLRVNDYIFGYRYTKSNNAPAFVFDKPGSGYTGIGANGESDTIYFGPVNTSDFTWMSNYSQKWKFQGLLIQGSPSSDSSVASMNRFQSDLFVQGSGTAPNTPTVAGFYLGKSTSDENRHMDIVSGADYSYIDFNKAGRTNNDYDVRLLVNVTNGLAEWHWGSYATDKRMSINGSLTVTGTIYEGGTALSSKYAASGHSHNSIAYQDTRSVNQTPQQLPAGVSIHLKSNGVDNINDGGNFHPVLGLKPWGDISGGPYAEITVTQNGRMWYRVSSSESGWNGWHRVATYSELTNVSGGGVAFANNTLYTVGDDVQIGDQNVAGTLCVKGVNGTTAIQFMPYNGNAATTKIMSNDVSSYGGLRVTGMKGDYHGILVGDNNTGMNVMSCEPHQGLYNESQGKWIIYYNRTYNNIGILTAPTTQQSFPVQIGAATQVSGGMYATGQVQGSSLYTTGYVQSGGNMVCGGAMTINGTMKVTGITEVVARIQPTQNNNTNLGYSDRRWMNIYSVTALNVSSDRNLKKDIVKIDDRYIQLFDMLQPYAYRFIDGQSGRIHTGFIAQDVEDAMRRVGLSDLDLAFFCKDVKTDVQGNPVYDGTGNPVYTYSLRYEEYIAITAEKVKRVDTHLKSLGGEVKTIHMKYDAALMKIAELEKRIDQLELAS